MAKKLIYLFVILALAVACNNSPQPVENTEVSEETTEEPTIVTVANFADQAGNLVGEQVEIKGTVNHTCKHSGKRMFIVDEGTEDNVKIEAGENIDSFDAELEGNEVVVTGIVNELVVDEAYLAEWEKEIMEELGDEHTIHDGKHEGQGKASGEEEVSEEEDHENDLEKIENLRNMLKEQGKDKLSFYSIECISYEVLPAPTSDEE